MVFGNFFKLGLRTLEQWRYDVAPNEHVSSVLLKLILESKIRTLAKDEMIRYVREFENGRFIPIDEENVGLIIRAKKCRIFAQWKDEQGSDLSKSNRTEPLFHLLTANLVRFARGRNILHEILQVGGQQFNPFVEFFKELLTQW